MDRHNTYDTNSIPIFTSLDNKDGDRRPMDKRRCLECPTCRDIEFGLMNLCLRTDFEGRRLYEKAVDWYIRHDPETHVTLDPKTTHSGNGTHQGWFAGTLTQSVDDDTTEDDMVRAMEKIFSQKTCSVDKYAWYVEYTKKQTPHIHFIYITTTGGRIHAKVFKRYWKQWDEKRRLGKGHQGGYHCPVYSDVAYREYISKDGGRSGKNFSLEDL